MSTARGMSKSKMELLHWENREEQGFWGKQGKQGTGSGLDVWSSEMEQRGERLELGTGKEHKIT